MGDTLPLIPEKGSLCADVRPIIRAVFRELDYLPPLSTELPAPVNNVPSGHHADQWIEKYKSECKEIRTREDELKYQHAKRLSRKPLLNNYQLSSPRTSPGPRWTLDRGLIARRDLVPTIEQNAARDESLWIKNILNRSSCDVSEMEVVGHSLSPAPPPLMPCVDEVTLQTLSVGAVESCASLPPLAPPMPPLPQPDYILCLPPQLDFVNFTIGNVNTQRLRLVNVSKFEIRLSVRPPKRQELNVELYSPRGLTVTSGAVAEIRVHFRPSDVRTVNDTLLIRVSMGRHFLVPIACYMQPPVLDILIPNVTSSVLSCTPAEAGACTPLHSCDVLELGARLLGDVHCAPILLHCDAEHASFFMLTEDAWLSLNLDCVTSCGAVTAAPFVLRPAWWGGGGAVRGRAWCRAPHAGLHAAALRVLSSTAVVRQLYVLADALLFRPDHLTIVAQEKDYDISGDGEPACEYYVNLGTTFPNRALSATVQLVNHSPVVYSYYWSVRPWGLCSCLEDEKRDESVLEADSDSEQRCVGAQEARVISQHSPEQYESRSDNACLLHVEPVRAQVAARGSCALHVLVPDAGARLGVQRAVLMLILKDIPKKSFPPDYVPMIISEEKVTSEPIPGVEGVVSEVCDVVCAQMEVWWNVVPVRFVLHPPVISLHHSRRVESVMLDIKATQLFGCEGARVTWQTPAHVPPPAPLCLTPAHCCPATLTYPLPSLPDHLPETDVITMVAANDEWRSQCVITRQCATRHLALQPAHAWLGVIAPGTHMQAKFQLFNDTHQQICWNAEAIQWCGKNEPTPACEGRLPCDRCDERACYSGLLEPPHGALQHRESVEICYNVNAPEYEGCVAALVRAHVADVAGARGRPARAALVVYRVLAPRLVLRVLPSLNDSDECSGCKVDAGTRRGRHGTATLRPRHALTVGRSTCYRLHVTNITPLSTVLHFDKNHDAEEVLKVKFKPNDFELRPYEEIDVRVVLEARKVCGRRLFVFRGIVERASQPVYLLVDTAIDGVKISCEVPLGGALKTDSFVIIPRTQKEKFPWEQDRPMSTTPEEVFTAEDRKREVVRENRCRCPFKMVYFPPVKSPESPKLTEEQTPIEIVSRPPSLTRVCACAGCTKPLLPELDHPICLQFIAVPLRTVRTRTLRLRNESVVTAHWSAAVRRWPRTHHRTLAADQWAGDVAAPGVVLQCEPARGVLGARADVCVNVSVYADCWGLYHDQLLIQIEDVEPIVLDVWVEAVGAPLQLALAPPDLLPGLTPIMWMSLSDGERVLRATNVSRAQLTVHAYTAVNHECPQDALPFRLYLRYCDVPPLTCACTAAFHSELPGNEPESCSIVAEMDTSFEIYLAPDYGPQTEDYYTVSPATRTVAAGERAEWRVSPRRDHERAPDVNLLLRLQPDHCKGAGWRRGEPAAQVVRLRQAARRGQLELSCRELRVCLCALDLPYEDVLRVRKRFQVLNVGSGSLDLCMEVAAPWSVLPPGDARHQRVELRLEPRSSTEMCVEVVVNTTEVWPTVEVCSAAEVSSTAATSPHYQTPVYPLRTITATPLHFFDDDNILKTVSLLLELEFPALRVTPPRLDFGAVADGDTRKMYFSVVHTSRTLTLDVATQWIGGKEFKIWPPFLRINPGESANVYLQYTATWRAAPAEGCARVYVCGGDGPGAGGADRRAAWCRAAVPVRAAPARDHKFRAPRHDHTDDAHLLPPDVAGLLPI